MFDLRVGVEGADEAEGLEDFKGDEGGEMERDEEERLEGLLGITVEPDVLRRVPADFLEMGDLDMVVFCALRGYGGD